MFFSIERLHNYFLPFCAHTKLQVLHLQKKNFLRQMETVRSGISLWLKHSFFQNRQKQCVHHHHFKTALGSPQETEGRCRSRSASSAGFNMSY